MRKGRIRRRRERREKEEIKRGKRARKRKKSKKMQHSALYLASPSMLIIERERTYTAYLVELIPTPSFFNHPSRSHN